jgi:hypothetical protein
MSQRDINLNALDIVSTYWLDHRTSAAEPAGPVACDVKRCVCEDKRLDAVETPPWSCRCIDAGEGHFIAHSHSCCLQTGFVQACLQRHSLTLSPLTDPAWCLLVAV